MLKRKTRAVPISFVELRKEVIRHHNGSPRKMNYEVNKRIVDKYLDFVKNNTEFNNDKSDIMITFCDKETESNIDLINERLGTTYRQLYILEVVMYLQEIKNNK